MLALWGFCSGICNHAQILKCLCMKFKKLLTAVMSIARDSLLMLSLLITQYFLSLKRFLLYLSVPLQVVCKANLMVTLWQQSIIVPLLGMPCCQAFQNKDAEIFYTTSNDQCCFTSTFHMTLLCDYGSFVSSENNSVYYNEQARWQFL